MNTIKIQCIEGRQLPVSRSRMSTTSFMLMCMIESYTNVEDITFYLPYTFESLHIISELLESKGSGITSLKTAIDILKINKSLRIIGVNKFCYAHISTTLRTEDVCSVHDFASEIGNYKLLYTCWRMFDVKYDQIFCTNLYFDCREATIDTLVSRPINKHFDEKNIFDIAYRWAVNNVSEKKSLRQLMEPFLPKIRFLTMENEIFESDEFSLVLTEKELEAIRLFFVTENLSCVPDNISKNIKTRDSYLYPLLFTYCNRYPPVIQIQRFMTKNIQFISEIFLHENCFMRRIRLPIAHKNRRGIEANLYFSINNRKWKDRKFLTCEMNGCIDLKVGLYIKKFTTFQFIVRFPNKEIIPRNKIEIKPSADRFTPIEDFIAIPHTKKYLSLDPHLFSIYCDVTLYF
ncbi:uncharacterized protein LOC111629205 [Centruroides sculpturatus]|uniref:uncharacterized protein LOC111629205 n=1 Tax=Centruroides sculpturatus TaxID=218467 RepID=UPI000C6EDE63|nr:uncharacterized protein LOC111629205 [Centruroides sculpturatus]